MSTPSTTLGLDSFLWGSTDHPVRHLSLVVVGYAALFVGLFAVLLLANALGYEDVSTFVYDPVLPAAIFGLPVAVGVLNGVLGGGLLAGLAVGVTPAASFGGVMGLAWAVGFLRTGTPPTGGDAPLWVLVLVFAGYGAVGALVGTGVGMVLRAGLAMI